MGGSVHLGLSVRRTLRLAELRFDLLDGGEVLARERLERRGVGEERRWEGRESGVCLRPGGEARGAGHLRSNRTVGGAGGLHTRRPQSHSLRCDEARRRHVGEHGRCPGRNLGTHGEHRRGECNGAVRRLARRARGARHRQLAHHRHFAHPGDHAGEFIRPKPGFHSDRCERARALFLLLPG